MALCRFDGDSDVYVFYRSRGGLECCGCRLSPTRDFIARDE
jgi:hypothetical protein